VREFTNPTYDGPKCACCNKVDTSKASTLLTDDNLVWSKDFDHIRKELAELLQAIDKYVSRQGKAAIQPELEKLTQKLIGE
jgi:hypothetical protein